MDIELFSMERYQSLYWHQVEYDLSESGVLPMSIRELLGPDADPEQFLSDEARLSAVRGIDRDACQHRRVVRRRDA